MKHVVSLYFVLLAISNIAYAVIASYSPNTQVFVTRNSLEPDKWSSVWLIEHHIDPNAVIEVYSTGAPLSNGVALSVPQSEYKRSGGRSSFENLLIAFEWHDPVLGRLDRIVTSIETTAWNSSDDPFVQAAEQNFRCLQGRYGRACVPVRYDARFFGQLYSQHGLAGWRSVGLPLSTNHLPEKSAKEKFIQCARDQRLCLKSVS